MSRYPNDRVPLTRLRRPLGYTLGDVPVVGDPSNPSILFGDPTLGGQTVIEQAAGVNQAFDPGMSFGVDPATGQPTALGAGDLASVGLGAALQAPNIPLQNAPAQPAAGWVRPALALALILLIVYGLPRE